MTDTVMVGPLEEAIAEGKNGDFVEEAARFLGRYGDHTGISSDASQLHRYMRIRDVDLNRDSLQAMLAMAQFLIAWKETFKGRVNSAGCIGILVAYLADHHGIDLNE